MLTKSTAAGQLVYSLQLDFRAKPYIAAGMGELSISELCRSRPYISSNNSNKIILIKTKTRDSNN